MYVAMVCLLGELGGLVRSAVGFYFSHLAAALLLLLGVSNHRAPHQDATLGGKVATLQLLAKPRWSMGEPTLCRQSGRKSPAPWGSLF
jgi:hypothetical protein